VTTPPHRLGQHHAFALTICGRAVVAGAMVGLFVAATAGQPALLAAAVVMLGLVSFSVAGGLRVLQTADALRLSVEFPEGADCVRGGDLPLHLVVDNDQGLPVGVTSVHLRGEGFDPVTPLSFPIAAWSKTRARFDVSFPRAGRWRFHGADFHLRGFLGLSGSVVYRPCEAPIKVRPRSVTRRQLHALTEGIGIERDRAGRFLSRRLGSGLELRELRDYVPGDPLKSVAWRATARRRRPLVRAFEEETIRRIQIVLDIGPTMRAGTPGGTALDRGIDLAAALCRHLGREKVGLTTYDHRIYGHFPARAGIAHLQHRLGHLLELYRVVDADLTEVCDAEVTALVGRFLEAQEGHALRRHWVTSERYGDASSLVDPVSELYDIGALYGCVKTFLNTAPRHGAWLPERQREDRTDGMNAQLRLFCALRGLSLPYRLTGPLSGTEEGLVSALGLGRVPGAADHWIVLSDFRGVDTGGPVIKAIRAATLHKKKILLVALDSVPSSLRGSLASAGASWVPLSQQALAT